MGFDMATSDLNFHIFKLGPQGTAHGCEDLRGHREW